MLQTFCEFSSDYPSLLRSLSDPVLLSRSGKIIQFPFSRPTVDEKTEEEQARLAERRKEQGKRLQEMAAKSRMEKVGTSHMSAAHVRMITSAGSQREGPARDVGAEGPEGSNR